jgi:hypothetical protein
MLQEWGFVEWSTQVPERASSSPHVFLDTKNNPWIVRYFGEAEGRACASRRFSQATKRAKEVMVGHGKSAI